MLGVRAVLIEHLSPRFSSFFFFKDTRTKQEIFPNFRDLTEGKISGTLISVPVFGGEKGKSGNEKKMRKMKKKVEKLANIGQNVLR